MRGTAYIQALLLSSIGIIPACAGNSREFRRPCGHTRDHPRVCGEQFLKVLSFTLNTGSSPRVRGTVVRSVSRSACLGIIPACAGNRAHSVLVCALAGDHPRVCGEQVQSRSLIPCKMGSSPRVRGTVRWRDVDLDATGIIPACAGNSLMV